MGMGLVGESKFDELCQKIFLKRFRMFMTNSDVPLITEEHTLDAPQIHDIEGGVDILGGVWTSENGSEEAILQMFQGVPSLSGHDEGDDLTRHGEFVGSWTINNMVEYFSSIPQLRFVDIDDVVEVYEILSEYVTEIKDARRTSVNFNRVSDEDMDKMDAVINALDPIANWLMTHSDKGNGDWKQLLRIGIELSTTQSHILGIMEERKSQDQEVTNPAANNPFDFFR